MPDALSKTVPIWCSVINRAIKANFEKGEDWDIALYTPPAVVSSQENRQIEAQMHQWATRLCVRQLQSSQPEVSCSSLAVSIAQESSYTLPDLQHPLRPLWVTPASSSLPLLDYRGDRPFFPVICVSASRQIHEGLERRQHGFSYVQGSGDDHELWGQVMSQGQLTRSSRFTQRYNFPTMPGIGSVAILETQRSVAPVG